MKWLPVALLCLLTGAVLAQTGTHVAGGEAKRKVQNASATPAGASRIDADADIVGVTVINDEVYIDGDRVPTGVTSFKGRKSGTSYRIQWGRDGNISVTEK